MQPKKQNKKGQSAVEYLSTYGWAILVVFLAIVLLISMGIFSEKRVYNEDCTIQPNLVCEKFYATTDGQNLNFAFLVNNGMGFPILIQKITIWPAGATAGRVIAENQNVYLKTGEKRFFVANNIPYLNNKIEPNTIQKLNLEVEYKTCKDKDETNCKNSAASLTTYITQGKAIVVAYRGSNFDINQLNTNLIQSSQQCVGGSKRCNGNIIEQCEWTGSKFEWVTEKICTFDQVCMDIGRGPECMVDPSKTNKPECSIEDQKRCNGDIIEICKDGKWKVDMDCSKFGKTCQISQQVPQCVDKPQTPDKKNPSPGIDVGCNIGSSRCEPTTNKLQKCVNDNGLGVWIDDPTCNTQCEQPIGLNPRCALCKEGAIQCGLDLFTYLICEKNPNTGIYENSPKSCPAGYKCGLNGCYLDNRPLCEPIGKTACGSQEENQDPNTIYRCTGSGWQEVQTCSNGCYKGKCGTPGWGEIDECPEQGMVTKKCTDDYLTLLDCRGHEWIRINCVGDTYCSDFGNGQADCIQRP
jgi:hypothetical protein